MSRLSIRPLTLIAVLFLSTTLAFAADEGATRKAVAKVVPSKAAATQPSKNITGIVTFTEAGGKLSYVADIDGLIANGKHGFHIHQKGDLSSADFSSAGPHFNPSKEKHGGLETPHHHAGDLGNLTADDKGHAHLEGTLANVTLGDGENSIVGKSVIVHAKEDDLATDPSGNSGGRVAGGVIELQIAEPRGR